MRLRRKKNRNERLSRVKDKYLLEQNELRENLFKYFDKAKPLYIEIGSGKGGFICENARQNPQINFLSVERIVDCIIMAMEKASGMDLSNIKFLLADAKDLFKLLPEKCADVLYINFCDPWPKTKHAKRRLTHGNMLKYFIHVLKDNGEIHFKTDNRPLFDFSVEEFKRLGFELKYLTYDLHNENTLNIMTEYEERFSNMGVPINRLEAVLTSIAKENLKFSGETNE